MSNAFKERRLVAEYSALIHARGWVANHDGNVSLRISGERFLITPTGVSKRLCTPDTLVECGLEGGAIGHGRPPSEVGLHTGAYGRKDVFAVIHAHPPEASAYSLCQAPIGPIGMPEVVVSLGTSIPLVPLFMPKDDGVKAAVAKALAVADVALLAGNGVIAVGPDLETAFLRMELLEHYAKILTVARGRVGDPVPLDAGAIERLVEIRKKAGLHRGDPVVGSAASKASSPSMQDTLRLVVAEEVKRALGGRS